ncbi:MAG: GNAT family N-acetyltransferase [Chloroflexota bacterium]|nr:GNAT family N-acetyltransferase [Chloroflexota bacterium]
MPEPAWEITRITAIDAALLARLNHDWPDEPWVLDQAQPFVANPDNLLLLATTPDLICGIVIAHRLQRLDALRAEVLLYSIDVHEAMRRQGIGHALIDATTAWARELGADNTWVLTERSNHAAMALYRAAGGSDDIPDVAMFTFSNG